MTGSLQKNIVLLHGWGYTPAVWQSLIEALALPPEKVRLICPNIHRPDFDLTQTVPPGAIVIAWSLGGMLAMQWAYTFPDLISHLVLIGSTPRFVEEAGWPHGLSTDATHSFKKTLTTHPAKTLKRFVALQTLHDANRAHTASRLETFLADTGDAVSALSASLETLFSLDLRQTLPTQTTVNLIHGEVDAVVPISTAEWLHAHLPASSLQVLSGVGHAPHIAEPDAVAEMIRKACLEGF